MHSRSPNACSSRGPNAQPQYPRILIAIGHFGRQVLWEQDGLLAGFALRVLVVRRTAKPMRQFADIVLYSSERHLRLILSHPLAIIPPWTEISSACSTRSS